MKNTKIRDVLAIIVVLLCFSYFFYISLSHYNARDNINVGDIKTAMVSIMTVVLTYYFGTSKSSTEKDESINSLIKTKNAKDPDDFDAGAGGPVS